MRNVRLLLFFQLVKQWKDFRDLVDVVFSILRDLSAITVLFGVFIFMYVLMGMELFAYKLKDTQTSTFNTFLESFLSVFIVLANDGWTKIYFNHQRYFYPISTSIYFISLVLLG